MSGCTPAFSAATSPAKTGSDTPVPPTAMQPIRAAIIARTASRGSAGPTPIERPPATRVWNATRSSADRRVSTPAPSPVVSP